jgi:cytochrome P450
MSQTGTVGATVTLDELEHDPYPIYKRLRAEEPISFVDAVELWLVTRWDEVNYVDKAPDLFTGETEPSTLNRTFGKNLLGSEGEYHQRIRSIIYPAFRVQAIGHYPDEVITPIANELIDTFAGRGEVEFVSEFAEPLSTRVVKRTLGLADVPDETLRRWFAELALGASNFEGDPEKQAPADEASAALGEAIERVLARVEREPDGSVLSWMAHRDGDDSMTREEIVALMGEPSGEYTVADGGEPQLWWAHDQFDFRVYLDVDGSVLELVGDYDGLSDADRDLLTCPELRS